MDVPKSKFGLKKEGKVSARYSLCFSLFYFILSLFFGVGGGGDGVKFSKHIDLNINLIFFLAPCLVWVNLVCAVECLLLVHVQ